MSGLGHTEKSLSMFRGCVYEVPNGNVYPNLLKLRGDVRLFLVVGRGVLVVGSAVVGTEGWPDGGGAVGVGRLGLNTSAVGLYTLPDRVTSTHVSMA